MDNRLLAVETVAAFQAMFEALNSIVPPLPPERRATVEAAARRIAQTKAAIMAELM